MPAAELLQTKLLPLLPAIASAKITALADGRRSVVRTTVLFSLAHLDTTAGMPTLIAALQDSRARIAIHALLARLDNYRSDPAPLVASDAQFTFTDNDKF